LRPVSSAIRIKRRGKGTEESTTPDKKKVNDIVRVRTRQVLSSRPVSIKTSKRALREETARNLGKELRKEISGLRDKRSRGRVEGLTEGGGRKKKERASNGGGGTMKQEWTYVSRKGRRFLGSCTGRCWSNHKSSCQGAGLPHGKEAGRGGEKRVLAVNLGSRCSKSRKLILARKGLGLDL